MKNKIHWIYAILLLVAGNHLAMGQDIYDSASSHRYADYLFRSKEFARAALEYERTCFLDSHNWAVHFSLMQSYRKSGQVTKGMAHYKKINHRIPEYQAPLFEHENNICVFVAQPSIFITADSFAELVYFKSPALLLSHDWKASKSYLISMDYKSDKTLGKYYEISQSGLGTHYKKPWLAGTMSTVVPGLGKVYTGYYKDGIIAFLMTGLSAFQAYRGYNSRGPRSGIFIIYTGMAAGFYLGNIYGSVKSARQKNRRLNEQLDARTRAVFYDWAE